MWELFLVKLEDFRWEKKALLVRIDCDKEK